MSNILNAGLVKRRSRRGVFILLAALLPLFACGDKVTFPPTDAGAPDAASDAKADGSHDASDDGPADASHDGSHDADAPSDAGDE